LPTEVSKTYLIQPETQPKSDKEPATHNKPSSIMDLTLRASVPRKWLQALPTGLLLPRLAGRFSTQSFEY